MKSEQLALIFNENGTHRDQSDQMNDTMSRVQCTQWNVMNEANNDGKYA